MLTPKEFTEKFKVSEKDFSYARAETWVVADASTALSYLMAVARQEMYMEEKSDSKEIVRMMRDLSDFITGQIDEMDEALDKPSDSEMYMYKETKSQFLTEKDKDGKYRWIMVTGSAFEDKDGEIISEKAFEDDCSRMELTGDYGELVWWHSDGQIHKDKEGKEEKEARPYLPLGSCDTSFVYEKLNYESGLYYDNEIGKIFSEKASEFGASKSFWHKEDEPLDGVYSYIQTKERSMLPRTKEANLLTRLFGGFKEKEMADNTERIAALEKKLGEGGKETVAKLLAQGKDMSDKAEKFLASKEVKVKKDKKDEDEEEDKKDTEGMKEFTETMTAVKESNDKLVLALKEQKDAFDVVLLAQTKELDELKANVAQTQNAVAQLLGFQPKGFGKFEASKEGKTVVLTDEQKVKAKEAEGLKSGFEGLADWLVTGERQVAA